MSTKKTIKWTTYIILVICISLSSLSIVTAQQNDLNIDQLLSISSQVSGDVQWTNDGNKILFKSGDGLSLVDVDEKYIQQIKPIILGKAGHFQHSQNISISPNGDMIAYISDKGGNPEVWLHSLKTGDERQITNLVRLVSTRSDGRLMVIGLHFLETGMVTMIFGKYP